LQLDDPFPLEELPPRVREIILTEFGGLHPTIREVAGVPDTQWLKLSGMGPRLVALMRSLTRGARRKAEFPSLAGMTDSELRAEYDRLNGQKKAITDQIRAIKAELRVRFETSCTSPKPPLSIDPY
jgi:hypothetical protein